ncbi:MAG: hypothetical protein K9J06_06595 [Flavobacteriales bacterium]|nr:hypothetical protein [Flavobacteriales bacterium]
MKCSSILVSISIILAFPNLAEAQKKVSKATQADAFVGKKFERKQGQSIDRFESIEEGEYKLRLRSKGQYDIVTFNDELEPVHTETVEMAKKGEPKKYELSDWYHLDFADKRLLLKATTDRDSKHNFFTLTELDEEDNASGSAVELARIDKDYYYIIENADLDYEISDDGENLLVYLKLPETRNQRNVKVMRYRYIVLDTELQVVSDRVQEFEATDGVVKYSGNAQFNDEGTVYCWATVDRGRRYKLQDRFAVMLYAIGPKKTISTRVDKVRATGVTSDLTEGRYSLFFSTGVRGFTFLWFGSPGGETGFASITWTGEKRDKPMVKQTPFTAEHAGKNQPAKVGRKQAKREKKGKPVVIPYLEIDKLIRLEDGSYVVLAQEQFIEVRTRQGSSISRTIYHFLNIHAFGLSADYELQWSTVVPLYQRGYTTDGRGYAYKIHEDKLYLMFNDNFRNLEKEWNTGKKPYKFTGPKNPVTIVSVDMKNADERQKRELLWPSSAVGGMFRPEMFYSPNGSSTGLTYIQGGKLSQSLVKIDFH